jgi:hypothetical protein
MREEKILGFLVKKYYGPYKFSELWKRFIIIITGGRNEMEVFLDLFPSVKPSCRTLVLIINAPHSKQVLFSVSTVCTY